MGLIQNLIKKIREGKEEESSEDRRQHIMEKLEQKKLSANERELNWYRERDRQEQIKKVLEAYRKRTQDNLWGGKVGNPAYAPNVISTQKNIFSNNKNIFSGKCIFTKNKSRR